MAPLLVDVAGAAVRTTEEVGPWSAQVLLAGACGDPVYSDPIRVTLQFGPDWPAQPPRIRVQGLLHFAMLDAERRPAELFYSRLARGSTGELSLRNVLYDVRSLLLDPLVYFGLDTASPEDQDAQRLRAVIQAVRKLNRQRTDVIRQYAPLARRPELFDARSPLRGEWFPPPVWEAHLRGTPEAWRAALTQHVAGNVYSMPFFTDAFCDVLLEEIFGFYASGLPARRPNSMNAYGIVLGDIGLEPLIDKLQTMLQPLGRTLFPGPGSDWDGHHCFVVRYREGEDLGLDMHTDDSDVTFNICLGKDFSGAGLQFCGAMGDPDHRRHKFTYEHRKGECVLHLGRQRHGADDIRSGERLNLVLWNMSSEWRNSDPFRRPAYRREGGPPDPVCVSYTHDRDYGIFKPYPKGKEALQCHGWCPPIGAEYEGFRADSPPGRASAQML